MKISEYTATDLVVAMTYGGLAEYSKKAADIIFYLAIAIVIILVASGVKISEIFGDEHDEFTPKRIATMIIAILTGLIMGHVAVAILLKHYQ